MAGERPLLPPLTSVRDTSLPHDMSAHAHEPQSRITMALQTTSASSLVSSVSP